MILKTKANDRGLKPHFRKPVTIVKESKPNIVVVIPERVNESGDIYTAAEEFNDYIYKVSKAEVQIKHENEILDENRISRKLIPVYIGKCSASRHLVTHLADMTNDGYVIEIKMDSIHIFGKNDLSTRFGVYGFLEDYIDVHWFLPEVFGNTFPENMGTHIPNKSTIEIYTTLDIQEASFKYRYIGDSHKAWPIRNKMNTVSHYTEANQNLYQINKPAHSFVDENFIDPHAEEHFSHPEYFATVNGISWTSEKLENESGDQGIEKKLKRLKLNIGNPELKDRFVEQVQTYISMYPTIDIINLFPSDGLGFDESEDSTAMDGASCSGYTVVDVNRESRKLGEEFGRILSKRYTMFYHNVLTDLVDDHDKIFMTGAYSAYQYAPLEVGCPDFVSRYRMDDKVILLITHSREHNHPISDINTPPNIHFAQSIDGWRKIYSKFGVYEYYRKGAMCELPFPIIHSIRHDIPYYYNNNFNFFYTQHKYDDIGTYGLNHYIAAKLLWNVNADVNELLDEFYSKFYGPVETHMRQYFETLERAAIASDLELSPSSYSVFLELFSDHMLDECRTHLDNAENGTDNELFLARINLSRVSLDYTQNVMDYLKEIEHAIPTTAEMTNRPFWDNFICEVAEDRAEVIRQTVDEFSHYKTITNPDYINGSTIMEQLLSLSGESVGKVREYFYGDSDQYTKERWLEDRGVMADPGYGVHELFDIWIYAYDVDNREHQINVINSDGSNIELGIITDAGYGNESGDDINKGFLLQNFSFEEHIDGDEEMTIEVYNFRRPDSRSRFYAFAIMPHDDTMTQEDVTNHYQNDIEFIRSTSIGFTEFSESVRNLYKERLIIPIKLYVE